MKKGYDIFLQGSKWKTGSNSNSSLWHDKWLSNGAFRSLICGPLNCDEDSLMVSEASWNTSSLSFDLRLDLSLRLSLYLYLVCALML